MFMYTCYVQKKVIIIVIVIVIIIVIVIGMKAGFRNDEVHGSSVRGDRMTS